ncbi:MAG: adenylate/guanylate cyclase domain-containing protein [Ramlibacter sp.]
MVDQAFRQWLAQISWTQAVRYSKTVFWLMLPAALALDVPLIAQGLLDTAPGVWLLAWQASVVLTCCAVLLVDRWPAVRGREAPLYLFCTMFMVLTTWAGVRAQLIGGGGMIVYAGGSTFIAAVICTPRPIRRPLYALSLAVLAIPVWLLTGDAGKVFEALVLPFCIIVLCVELDRFTYSQHRALYDEKLRAETERARADKVLYNVLPVSIADELKRADRVNAVKFENMGVLFADIAGFTNFSRALPPDALVLMLNQIFSSFDDLVERHGLEKIKTIGDAYMVISHQRIPALCDLALDLREAMERYNQANGTALGMRIGIHAGPAVAGVIGVKRFLYDVWGDTVNVASRMEGSGEPGAIQVTEAVVRQAREHFRFEARAPVEIKGRGPMRTWWLLGPHTVPAAQQQPEAAVSA